MQELLHGAYVFLLYVIPAAGIMLLSRHVLSIPDEIFRKFLHFILLGTYFPFLFAFQTWWLSAGFALLFAALVYPILALLERIPAFSAFVTERKAGELKHSLVLAMGMATLSITVCWGIFGDKLLVLACIYAWGVGDAFAALVGKRFGRHKITLPHADPRKSVEGTAAMFLCSTATVTILLLVRGGLGAIPCLGIALITAGACAYVELCTTGGNDTVTCPTAAMLVLIPLVKLLGG